MTSAVTAESADSGSITSNVNGSGADSAGVGSDAEEMKLGDVLGVTREGMTSSLDSSARRTGSGLVERGRGEKSGLSVRGVTVVRGLRETAARKAELADDLRETVLDSVSPRPVTTGVETWSEEAASATRSSPVNDPQPIDSAMTTPARIGKVA
ncbi:MAG: hypothetical protein LBM23_05250 [Propionibacteriaceae bacterium]|nr:hypothetical protein [Propionibacteriaceae bacterium]